MVSTKLLIVCGKHQSVRLPMAWIIDPDGTHHGRGLTRLRVGKVMSLLMTWAVRTQVSLVSGPGTQSLRTHQESGRSLKFELVRSQESGVRTQDSGLYEV